MGRKPNPTFTSGGGMADNPPEMGNIFDAQALWDRLHYPVIARHLSKSFHCLGSVFPWRLCSCLAYGWQSKEQLHAGACRCLDFLLYAGSQRLLLLAQNSGIVSVPGIFYYPQFRFWFPGSVRQSCASCSKVSSAGSLLP